MREAEQVFHQRDDGFVPLGPCGGPCADLLGVKGTIPRRYTTPILPKWQGRRIIPIAFGLKKNVDQANNSVSDPLERSDA